MEEPEIRETLEANVEVKGGIYFKGDLKELGKKIIFVNKKLNYLC